MFGTLYVTPLVTDFLKRYADTQAVCLFVDRVVNLDDVSEAERESALAACDLLAREHKHLPSGVLADPVESLLTTRPWWDTVDALGTAGFIEAWGSNGEAAGYYPGAESLGTATAGTVTGRLEDAGSWSFASLEPPWLWCAIWPRTASTVNVDATMRIIVEE